VGLKRKINRSSITFPSSRLRHTKFNRKKNKLLAIILT